MRSAVIEEFSAVMKMQSSEETEQARPYISPSQITMFLDCSARYMFRYIFGIRVPPKSYFIRGRAIHKGIEHNFTQKIDSHQDLSLKEVQEAASEEFDSMLAEAVWDEGEDPGEIKDKTMELLSLYHTEVAPKIQPVMVERPVTIELPETGYLVKGILDLVDSEGNIRDTKSKSRTPPQSEADGSLQLTAYAMAYRQLTGKAENSVILDNLVDLKTPKYVPLKSQRTELDIRRFKNIANSIISAIKAGAYCPNPNSMMCSETKCDYWKICHEIF